MKVSSITARTAWAVAALAGLVLLCLGLEQTFYLGTVTNAFEIDGTGNTCILAGAVVGLAAVGWSRYRGEHGGSAHAVQGTAGTKTYGPAPGVRGAGPYGFGNPEVTPEPPGRGCPSGWFRRGRSPDAFSRRGA
ncbi:hypothetical protein ACVWYS_003102 [Arthrobacter sp. TE12231]